MTIGETIDEKTLNKLMLMTFAGPIESRKTVARLVEMLKKLPQDMLVLVDGYEDGFDNFRINEITVKPSLTSSYYEGVYRKVYDGERNGFPAILLARDEVSGRRPIV